MPGFVRPDSLRQMIETGEDHGFLVVDVRPQRQYSLDHIPGAVNLPLNEIETRTEFFGCGRDVVFYCRNGVRSKVAAILAVDCGLDPERAFTLEGGISAYSGEILLELPRLALFDGLTEHDDVVAAALNFEKGAWQFYTVASTLNLASRTTRFLRQMARLETDHARVLFDRLSAQSRQSLSFDRYFDSCSGDIVEGGRSFDHVLGLISDDPVDEDILDLALEIETAAYDLYKQAGVGCGGSEDRTSFFLGLAGDEKKHMTMIASFLSGHLPQQ